jgi:ATP-dependent helicase/nuclease subunit B
MVGQPQRIFFDWKRPPLHSAADWIAANLDEPSKAAPPIIVLPTARSRRRLIELLKEHSVSTRRIEVITVGSLPEKLYEQQKETASDLVRNLAWIAAIQKLPKPKRENVFPSLDVENLARLSSLATRLQTLHERLGAETSSFESVSREVKKIPDFPQTKLWEGLAKLQGLYYRELEAMDLWDPQAARNVAIYRRECQTTRPIVLVGLTDMNRGPLEMLEQVAEKVTTLIFCDPVDQSGFDDLGCLIPDYWINRRLKIPDATIRIVDKPADQAAMVGAFLKKHTATFGKDRLCIGMPDEKVWPQVERETTRLGFDTYYAKGISLQSGAVMRLLEKVAEYLDDPSYQNFAELVRHPDMSRWISRLLERDSWLAELDGFQNLAIPARVDFADSEYFATPDLEDFPVTHILRAFRDFFAPVAPVERTVQQWAGGWAKIVTQSFDEILDETLEALDTYDQLAAMAARQIVEALEFIHADDRATLPLKSAREALDFCRNFMTDPVMEGGETSGTVPVLGWLDLAFEDADAMIVTGMNNHVVPMAEASFAFLPNSVCSQLGLLNPQRRLARDLYAASLMHACRSELMFVVGRRDVVKNPLQISRLLLHASDEELVRRATAFFDFDRLHPDICSIPDASVATRPTTQQLVIPRPNNVVVPTPLSVTRFRDYLKCPYRFYLAIVLKLEEVSDSLRELDGGAFGDLAHKVLEAFGFSSVRHSDDPSLIRAFLQDTLTDLAHPLIYRSRLPSVTLQVENLRYRLEKFAEHQAEHRRSGWLIASVENKLDYVFDVDGNPFVIRGMIDRIDQHEDGRLAVWDYKTSEAGKSANQAHRDGKGNWTDLQLPLYRHLVSKLYPDIDRDQVGLGYVILPGSTSKIKFESADWTPEDLKSADECAVQVMRSLNQGIFWPPNPEPPDFSESFAAICQDQVFEQWTAGGVA